MAATGAELPAFEFTVWKRPKRILLEVVRSGTLTKVTKTERQHIRGGGGGGYVYGNYTPGYGGYVIGQSSPISITTTYGTTMELWILGADGRESSFRLYGDIPLKEGHTITIVNGYLEGTHYTLPCLVVNHTACEAHFLPPSDWWLIPGRDQLLLKKDLYLYLPDVLKKDLDLPDVDIEVRRRLVILNAMIVALVLFFPLSLSSSINDILQVFAFSVFGGVLGYVIRAGW
jgi:hypothetical protein